MESQHMLGILLNLAEQQSQTTGTLLDALRNEIGNLTEAGKTVAATAERVSAGAASVQESARTVTPALR